MDCLIQAIEEQNHGRVRRLLFRGVDWNAKGVKGNTPMAAAYAGKDKEMVIRLLKIRGFSSYYPRKESQIPHPMPSVKGQKF